MTEQIQLALVGDQNRARKDLGDIDSMAASIKEFGLIQPIVLNKVNGDPTPTLVVGGRRLAALRKLGITVLEHGTHYIWRTETDNLRLKSMELEENLKRKDMTWDEVIEAKAKLLEIMQSIHGVALPGRMSRIERAVGASNGFNEVKLSAMLGETPSATNRDLQLAAMVKLMPDLKKCENKNAALRKATLDVMIGALKHAEAKKVTAAVTAVQNGTVATPAPPATNWSLFEGDFRDNITRIPSSSVDLVFTDLPYGVDIQKNDMQGITFNDTRNTIISLLPSIAQESYRVLRDGRYAVYWFGFNNYAELYSALLTAGFQVNPIPVIWIKHRKYSPNPLRWYASGYEQALIACKGDAKLIRPGSIDIIDLPNTPISQKLQVAQKPIELCEKFILDMTMPTGTVLDMFAGTGSTGLAAIKNGRKTILFEKDHEQCLLIRNRLSTIG